MTQNAEIKKRSPKKSIFKKLLLILLVLVLIVITATVTLYIYSKTAETTKDDVTAFVSSETVPAAERYSFDASSLKMEMSLNKHDLWCLLKEAGVEQILGDITDDLENSGFTLQSYGMDITDKGILISTELTYGDLLRLPLKLLTNTSVNDGTLTLSLSNVYLGNIRLPLETLPLDRLASGFGMDPDFSIADFKYDVDLSDWGLLSMLTNINYENSRMVMVYKLDESMFAPSVGFSGNWLNWYAEECTDCIEVLREYQESGAVGERFKELVENFRSNPESFSGFIVETLAVSSDSVSEEYMSKNRPWLVCFMPEVTDKRIDDLHDSLYNLCSERSALFDGLLDNLQSSYNSRKFGIDKRGLTYNKKPFDLKSYLGDDWAKYAGWLDDSSFRPVLIGVSNALNDNTPALREITDSAVYIDSVDTLNQKFPLGFIIKMKDGTPVLKYYKAFIDRETIISNETVVLDDAQYESMMKNPLVPIWRD